MKKIFVYFAVLAAMLLMVGCGGGSTTGDNTDTGDTSADGDSADSGSTDTGTTEPTDTGTTEPTDTGTSEPTDTGTTEPTDTGEPDTAPDEGDTEPDNDYPQTPCDPNPCISDANSTGVCAIKNDSYVCGCNSGYIFDGTLCIKSLPECSPESATPCIDSATGLIWSAKSANKMPWNDAANYCQNLTEGDFNDWRLPSIAVLKTLVQNCSSAKCTDDYTGKYSKFGDTVYLWSSSEGEDSTAQSIYFSDAGTYSVSIDTNVNVRCVRRESESRESNCTGLIENSVWNTTSQITQTWDWETAGWTPSPEGSYNAEGSSSECRFKCDSNSFREGSKCLNPCKPNPCNSIGETGTCIGKSANEYRCECEENYFWDTSEKKCLNPCKPNPCNSIGETGICLSKSANEYRCECEDTYGWSSYLDECIKTPCRENSCNIPNSTGICNPVTETQYACECSSGYYWHGTTDGCKSEPATLGNICTGQNKCYNNEEEMTCPTSSSADFFGQDAYYASLGKCTPQSFTVKVFSGDNVVLDNSTGLMWQQTILTDTYKWADAVSYCNDLSYAGYSDWRLPTPQELLTIVDNSKYGPAINTTYFPNMSSTSDSVYYWSSKPYGTNYVQLLRLCYGNIYHFSSSYNQSSSLKVVCVRGNELPKASFTTQTISGEIVVKDSTTGLMWQKTYPSSTTYTWQNALKYCESLVYAGYDDWRLPNKNELASLLNYDKSAAPYSDFPDMPSTDNYFWSSSTVVYGTYYAWLVDFDYGRVSSDGKTYSNGVRCVR